MTHKPTDKFAHWHQDAPLDDGAILSDEAIERVLAWSSAARKVLGSRPRQPAPPRRRNDSEWTAHDLLGSNPPPPVPHETAIEPWTRHDLLGEVA